jgi:hypothetical protein
LNSTVAETLMPVARGVKLNKKQEEEFSKSDYPLVDFYHRKRSAWLKCFQQR